MGIRTLCVVLVLVVHGPTRWVFAVLAVILPYIAVVMANMAGSRRNRGLDTLPGPLPGPLPPPGDHETSPEQPNSQSHERTA